MILMRKRKDRKTHEDFNMRGWVHAYASEDYLKILYRWR